MLDGRHHGGKKYFVIDPLRSDQYLALKQPFWSAVKENEHQLHWDVKGGNTDV
jgi:hypothetical protein